MNGAYSPPNPCFACGAPAGFECSDDCEEKPVKKIKCARCGKTWDTISPCAPCAVTKSHGTA